MRRFTLVLLSAASAAGGAHAQTKAPDAASAQPTYTEILKEKQQKDLKELDKRPDGWDDRLTVGTTFALSSSTSVVGRPDGLSASLGGTVDGRFAYKRGLRRWVTTVGIQVQHTRTPALDGWIKSLDAFKVESTFLRDFHGAKWVSFYAGASLETALFGGEENRPAPTAFSLKELVGPPRVFTAQRFLLTKEFSPTQLQQGIGANYQIYESKAAKVTAKTGLGLLEALTRNGIAITDAAATPIVLTRLEDYAQIGGQVRLAAEGAFRENLTYNFFADFFFPMYSSIDPAAKGLGSYHNTVAYDIQLKVGMKLAKWASLDYVLGVRRIPLLADVTQIWNGLFVSFAFTVIEERKPPKNPAGPTPPKPEPPKT